MSDVFFYKSTCDTCRKGLKVVRALRADLPERNFSKSPLTRAEIERILDTAGSVGAVVNGYNKTVRERGWAKAPPPREQYIEALLADNNLLRRPVLLVGDAAVVGRDEEAWRRLLG
jgi:arsenate reductase